MGLHVRHLEWRSLAPPPVFFWRIISSARTSTFGGGVLAPRACRPRFTLEENLTSVASTALLNPPNKFHYPGPSMLSSAVRVAENLSPAAVWLPPCSEEIAIAVSEKWLEPVSSSVLPAPRLPNLRRVLPSFRARDAPSIRSLTFF